MSFIFLRLKNLRLIVVLEKSCTNRKRGLEIISNETVHLFAPEDWVALYKITSTVSGITHGSDGFEKVSSLWDLACASLSAHRRALGTGATATDAAALLNLDKTLVSSLQAFQELLPESWGTDEKVATPFSIV